MSKQKSESESKKIHNQCKHVISFHNHYTRFLKTLKGSFPELKRTIAKCYKYYKSVSRELYIKKTLECMKDHINHISKYDEGIFSNDYQKGKLNLLIGLDFKNIFKIIESDDFGDDDLRESTKKHIFNHLQSIYVISELALDQMNEFNSAINKQKEFLINMLKNMNMDENLKERIAKLTEEENESSNGSGIGNLNLESLEKLSDIFGGDNFITKLAKDITEDLNLGGDGCTNPVEAITELFANDGEKLQELIVKIGDRIEEKVKSGEITAEQLTKEAEEMKEKMSSVVGDLGLPNMGNPKEYFEKEFEKLSEENKEKFADIPEFYDLENSEWTEEQTNKFNEFMKVTMSKGFLGGLMPDDASSK